jgi:DNA polymerase III sliding clamp (beta) subunit (PCNA family)
MKRQKALSGKGSQDIDKDSICAQLGSTLPVTRESIDDRKGEIVRLHTEIGESLKTSVGKAIRIGELLINIKGELEHGEWGIWIKENLPFSQSTAERYMAVSEYRDKFVSLPNLTIFDAYKLLPHKKPQHNADQSPDSHELHEEAEVPRSQGEEKSPTEPEAETPDKSAAIETQEKVQEVTSLDTEHTETTKLLEGTEWDGNGTIRTKMSPQLYFRSLRAVNDLSHRPHREGKIVTLAQFVTRAVIKECTRVEKEEKEIRKGEVEKVGVDGDISQLRKIIAKCACFSTTKGLIPEYGYLYLKDDSIIAINGITGIKYRSPITFEEEFVLPAQIFSSLLSNVAPGVTVKLEKKEDHVLLRAGRFRTRFPLINTDSQISLQVPPEDNFTNLPDGFTTCLKHLKFSGQRNERVKESLKGINYDGQSFYASDNITLRRVTPTHTFSLNDPMFIPSQLLEHLIEDNPLGYYIDIGENLDRHLWFNFEKYMIFGFVSDKPFPMGKEIFDKVLSERENSVQVIPRDLAFMKKAIKKVAIVAEQYMNRLNLIACNGELILYAQTPAGMEAIEFVPADIKSNMDRTGFVVVDINFFKEEIEKTNEFFFTKDFVYFMNSEIGLESILKPLGVEDGPEVMERVEEYSRAREI